MSKSVKEVKSPYNPRNKDEHGAYIPTNVDDAWLPMRRGLIQNRIELGFQKFIPNLFENGRPSMDGKEWAYCLSWKRGILRVYLRTRQQMRVPGSLNLAIIRLKKRYPNIRVQMHDVTGATKYPKSESSFEDYSGDY